MEIHSNQIKLGNTQLFFRLSGNGSEVVVLMHGIPTNSFLWIQVIPQLAQKYTVIAPDLLGYGQSGRGPAEELTLPKQAEYILGILDQLGIRRAHFVGHDLGGGVAQILAVNHAERVASIVVADGVCFSNWPLPQVVALRYPTAPEFEPGPLFIERLFRTGLYHQELATADWLQALIEPFNHQNGPRELQTAATALEHYQTQEIAPFLPQIRIPVSILWGQHDRLLPPYWGERLHRTIPNSVLKIIPEAGHFSMIDNPIFFTTELLQHFQRSISVKQGNPVLV